MGSHINIECNENRFRLTENVKSILRWGKPHSKQNVKFSVLIPTYKRRDMLIETLDSVRKQKSVDFDWEIIILDNEPFKGNANENEEYIAKLKDDRIVYYRNTENIKPGDNFNRGIKLSSGEWVMMVHDDDLLMPAALYNMDQIISHFQTRYKKRIGAVCTSYYQFTYDPEYPRKSDELVHTVMDFWGKQPTDYNVERLTHFNPLFETHIGASIPSCGTTYNREAVLEIGGFNEDLGITADLLLCYCMERKWTVLRTSAPYGMYRWGCNTMIKLESSMETVNSQFAFFEYQYSLGPLHWLYGKIFLPAQYLDFVTAVVDQRNLSSKEKISVSTFDHIYSRRPGKISNFIYKKIIKRVYRNWKRFCMINEIRHMQGLKKTLQVMRRKWGLHSKLCAIKQRIFPASSRSVFTLAKEQKNQIQEQREEAAYWFDRIARQQEENLKQIYELFSKKEEETKHWADQLCQTIFNNERIIAGQTQQAVRRECAQLNGRLEQLCSDVTNLKKTNENIFWLSQAHEGEYFQDTQKRVFNSLGKTNKDVADLQTLMLDIASFFDKFCRKHGLTYWMWSGTLLGAIRHQGFIPWDDDMDFCMMRKDYDHFVELLKQTEDRFELKEYYECGVQGYRCGRFAKLRYSDPSIKCYVDVFPFDEDDSNTREMTRNRYFGNRNLLHTLVWDYCVEHQLKSENAIIEELDTKAGLDKIFDDFVKAYTPESGDCLQWGLDLFLAPEIWLWKKEDFFPVTELRFENKTFYAPRHYMHVVKELFGDIYELPKDMHSEYHSSVFGFISDDKDREAIGKIVQRIREEN